MTAQQLAGALAGSHGRRQALAGLGLSLPVAGCIGACRVAEAQPDQHPQAVSIEGKDGPGPCEQVNAVRSRLPDARVGAPRRPGDGKLRAPAQTLDSFRRAGAGDDAAQHILRGGQDLLRREPHLGPEPGQRLPAPLVIDQVGDVLAKTSSQPSADGTGSAGPPACSSRSSSTGKSFIPVSLARPATDAAWSGGPHHAGTDPGGPDADRALSAPAQNDLIGVSPDVPAEPPSFRGISWCGRRWVRHAAVRQARVLLGRAGGRPRPGSAGSSPASSRR